MLKQIWRWVSLFPLLHPVWFNLLLLVLAWSLVGVAYQSNDDLVIASVLDGWGDPSYADAHVIFVNPLLTGLLLKVAPVLGGVSVWPVFLALATLSSGAAIFTMLTAHARKARRYDFNTLVLLLVWLLIMPGFYAALQFSHAAFLTGFTGVLACLKYGSSWRGWCAGVFLCVLGSMVRLDAALVCDAFWGAILLAGSLEGLRPSREKLFALSRLWLALACVLISSFSLNEYNKYAHRNVLEGCDVAAWNQARALLSDTCPIRQESAYQCEKYGVFANDIRMVRMFTNCDMDVFNTDYLERLLLARDGGEFWPRAWARGEKALHLFSWDSVMDLLPCWILFGLACRVSFRRGDSPALVYCVGSLLVLILLGAIAYVSIVLMVCWKETHVAAPGKDYEAMLVLGAQVKPDGTPSLQLQWRLEKAAETYRQKKVPVVVCGGQGGNEPAPEAVVMRDVLIGLGVDEDMILMDTTSASTHSNIKNAMQLLGGRNVTKVMIITSDYHLPRAIAIAEDNGLTAYGIGAPTKLGLRFWLKNHCREALAWCKYWAVKYTHLPLE